jgi:hypothetical protein
MANEMATIPVETTPEALTVEDFRQVQALLGEQGFQMVTFEMDGLFARFDNVRSAEPAGARVRGR